jgi:heme A synthase
MGGEAMIDEAVGKILGMAMAYGASALGMFVAYINYRKRIVKAEKIMSPAAWGVILLSVVAVLGAVVLVATIAGTPVEPPDSMEGAEAVMTAEAEPEAVTPVPARREPEAGWSMVGVVLPGLIFLFATWVTAALHRHFSTQGHGS